MTDPNVTTDPRDLADADAETGELEVDPVSGYELTGHEWAGITELNTAFPNIVVWALIITHAYAVIAWILLPAWPLGDDYTRGLLGLDQGEMAIERYEALSADRSRWLASFETGDFDAIQKDAALMIPGMAAAHRLFQDNCAACHGPDGGGGPGFPALNGDTWLWGGHPETVAETVRVGINAANDDTRFGQMPAFDWLERDERDALADYVVALHDGAEDAQGAGAQLFAENCSSCHGDRGEGGLMNGAPSLRDKSVIYGQDRATVLRTLRHGRQGVMPAWSDRLSEAEINLLALYVATLGEREAEQAQ
ncbi:cytochrome-c oxidase, cbb3-type subunit III [Roseovarius spongiae]|nr:cytochrome-c oxidase, cbb3-type subunit III [Roseovarius spongiae]